MSDRPPRDCPECQSAGSVTGDFCEVCYADLTEWGGDPIAADLPPAAPGIPPAADRGEPVPLRFSDVIEELRVVAGLAGGSDSNAPALAAACRRAETLLEALRRQFVRELLASEVAGRAPIVGPATAVRSP